MSSTDAIRAAKALAELIAWFDHEQHHDYRKRLRRAARLAERIVPQHLRSYRRKAKTAMEEQIQ